jgi:copper chaperone NosL
MYDFWRWEYDYGHDLNPEAAIQVPGMAYQPPLIGYKQLLNFAAYSIPDIGGFIFIGVGFILLLATIIELKSKKKHRASDIRKDDVAIIASFLLIFSASCNRAPQPIKIGADTCSFCKMTISDNRFGGEIITKKGKAYKFDDIHCLVSFNKSGAVKAGDVDHTYLVKFNVPHNFIEASKATFFKSNEFRTPMGGNVAAFESEQDLRNTNEKFKGTVVSWNDLVK